MSVDTLAIVAAPLTHFLCLCRVSVKVESTEIVAASLHRSIPLHRHLYALPFLSLYPVLAYAYFIKYDEWLKSEEWTFLACVVVFAGHALSFLVTRWSTGAKAWITTRPVSTTHTSSSDGMAHTTTMKGFLCARCRLHTSRSRAPPRVGRDRAVVQERLYRPDVVHLQLSARYLCR